MNRVIKSRLRPTSARSRCWRRTRLFRPLGEALEARAMLDGAAASNEYGSISSDWFAQIPASAPSDAAQWIVRLTPTATKSAASVAGTAELINQTLCRFDVVRGLGLPGLVLVQTDAPAEAVRAAFSGNPNIASFDANQRVRSQATPTDPEFANQTHHTSINVRPAWDITTGKAEVVVAVVDSGIDLSHPDLYRNVWLNPGEIPASLVVHFAEIDADDDGLLSIRDLNAPASAAYRDDLNANGFIDAEDLLADPRWADRGDTDANGFIDDLFGWDFVNNDNNPLDDNGHGTHVSGILAAEANNGIGVVGVTWHTSLLPVKFLNDANVGDTANAIAATNYVTALRTRVAPAIDSLAGSVNVRVINSSWGVSSGTGDVNLRSSIAAAGDAGILLIAGAGNGDILGQGIDLDSTPFFPASYDLDNIISVAATDADDNLAPFSNFGVSSVDIAAPGIGILSTEPSGDFGTRNGTSMATPLVSGVAALVFATHPDAAVSEVKTAILESATRLSSLQPFLATSGRLDAFAALQAQTFAPQARLQTAADITAANNSPQNLTVRFSDTDPIDASSFDGNDLIISRLGFASTEFSASLVNVSPLANATSHDVAYELMPPGGTWDAIDSGVYEVRLRGGEVRDASGVESQGRTLGTFRVQIADANLFIVNSTADSVDVQPGDGQPADAHGRISLRAAIMEANGLAGEQTILIPEGAYLLALPGGNEDAGATGDLDLIDDVSLIGTSALTTIIAARKLDRVLEIGAAAQVDLAGVTISGGSAATGGGIRNLGMLTFVDSRITGNNAQSAGGGIENRGSISITKSWIDANETADSGNAGGGGLFNDGAASIDSSTFSSNRTAAGVIGNAGGGAIQNTRRGAITILNSTLSGNTASKGNGGGIYTAGQLTSTNATFTENAAPAGFGGGIFTEPGISEPVAFDSTFGIDPPAFDQFERVKGLATDTQGNLYVADATNNRVQVFDSAGAFKFSFGSTGSRPGQFREPTSIAVDSAGRIYVGDRRVQAFDSTGQYLFTIREPVIADEDIYNLAMAVGPDDHLYVNRGGLNQVIFKFKPDGTLERTIELAPAEFGSSFSGGSMAVDSSGHIILAKGTNDQNRVFVIDSDGSLLATFGENSLSTPVVSLGPTGEIYLADPGIQGVKKFSADGVFLSTIVGPTTPTAIAVDRTGVVHVFEQHSFQVKSYTPNGGLLQAFGRPLSIQPQHAIAADAQGALLISDKSSGRIRVFNPDRSLRLTFGETGVAPGKFDRPTAVAWDSQGRIYVADTGNHRVQVFDPQGNFIRAFGSQGAGDGQFQSPGGIVVNNDGRIFVSDTLNHRIQVFSSSGTFLFAFGEQGSGDGQFNQPRGLAFDADGQLYVADLLNDRVVLLDSQGTFLAAFHELSGYGALYQPCDVAVDPTTGNISIHSQSVVIINDAGVPLFVFNPQGAGAGQRSLGIDIDSSGFIYVVNESVDGIQVFRSNPGALQRGSRLKNTILAGNNASAGPDGWGDIFSKGNNLYGFGDDIRFVEILDEDIVGGFGDDPIAAHLGPLQAMRGFVPTHGLLPGSPAIDAVSHLDVIDVDQLGIARPADGNGDFTTRSDIGAVERFDSEISGVLFEDADGDGLRDPNERGLAGITVFIDSNFNGFLDRDEPFAITQADDPSTPLALEMGQYAFLRPPGPSRLIVIPPQQYEPTSSAFIEAAAAIHTRKVVESATPIAELGGAGLSYLLGASLDGKNIVFSATAENSFTFPDTDLPGTGLFRADRRSAIRPLVSLAAGSFDGSNVHYPESFDGGKVLFQSDGLDGTGRAAGLYLTDSNGATATLASANTMVPGGVGTFGDKAPQLGILSEGVVAFVVNPGPTELEPAKFYLGNSGNSLFRVTNLDQLDLLQAVTAAEGTNLAFWALDQYFHQAIYTANATTGATLVVDDTTPIPGGSGSFLVLGQSVSLDAGQVAFYGEGSNSQAGLYIGTNILADFLTIADKNSPIPQGDGNFTKFAPFVAQDNGIIAFIGEGGAGQQGIYLHINGQLRKLVDMSDRPDGKSIDAAHPAGPFDLSRDAVSGNHIAYTVRFMDGSETIYLATIDWSAAQEIELASGTDLNHLDFAMRPLPGSLAGVVFADTNADGTRSSTEAGLSGWTVYLDRNKNGSLNLDEPQQVTDSRGQYLFDDLPGNQAFRLGLIIQSGFVATSPLESPGFRTLLVPPGQDVTSGSFGVNPVPVSAGVSNNGVVSGTVFEDLNANGRRDAGENGAEGWTVFIDANSNARLDEGELNTSSRSDGSYQLIQLANNGGYTIRVVPQNNSQQTTPLANAFLDAELDRNVTPQDTMAVDLNNDGALDIAIANSATNEVQLLLNAKTAGKPLGSGRFTALPAVSRLNNPTGLAAGDFNHDGRTDLAVANGFQNQLSILLQQPQSTTGLSAPISIPVGLFQVDVAALRLNNDSLDDLAVLLGQQIGNTNGQVVLFRGQGNGQFAAPITIEVGNNASSLAAADLDGDGDQDLIVATIGDKALQVLRNNGGNLVKLPPLALTDKPYFVTAADVTGDGQPDLLTTNLESNTLTLLANFSAAGAIAFAPAEILGANTGPQSIAASDIDLDGDLDLVVADGSPKNVTILRNRGQGVFAAPESAGIATFNAAVARSLSVADLNSDGLPDVVAARGDSNKIVSGEFAGSISLLTNQLSAGVHRAAVPTGNEIVAALDFGISGIAPANLPPTMNDILPPPPINEDSADITVTLSGLSPGAGENQPLRISALSDNAALISSVTVDYQSPANTATIRLAFAADRSGQAVVTVTLSDGGLDADLETEANNAAIERSFTVTVNPLNDPPAFDSLPAIVAIDRSAATQTISLTGLAAGGGETQSLRITATTSTPQWIQNLPAPFLATGATANIPYTTTNASSSGQITITVTDGGLDNNLNTAGDNLSFSQTIGIVSTNNPPSVSLANVVTSLLENSSTASRVKLANIQVSDDGVGGQVVTLGGSDARFFEIVGTELFLAAGVLLDHETKPQYAVTVAVDDPTVGTTPDGTAALTLNITNVNEPPSVALTNATTSLPENSDNTARRKLADIAVSDDSLAGAIVLGLSGPNAARFEILNAELYLAAGTALDHESQDRFQVTVEVNDPTLGGPVDASVDYVLSITDVNEAPSELFLSNFRISPTADTTSGSAFVGKFVAIDEDSSTSTYVYSLVAGDGDANNADFQVSGSSLSLKQGVQILPAGSTYSVRARLEDGPFSLEQSFELLVTGAVAINHPPSFLKGPDPQNITDESNAVSLPGWATDISRGPGDSILQIVQFVVTSDNSDLFLVSPAVDTTGQLTFTIRPNTAGSANVSVVAVDDGGTANGGSDTSAAQTFTIQVAKTHPWHNTLRPFDVRGGTSIEPDNFVDAGDVLAIINYINSVGAGPVPASAAIGLPFGFLDTNKDNSVAADDALEIINAINTGQGGEGEPTSRSNNNSITTENSPPILPATERLDDYLLSLLAADMAYFRVKRHQD